MLLLESILSYKLLFLFPVPLTLFCSFWNRILSRSTRQNLLWVQISSVLWIVLYRPPKGGLQASAIVLGTHQHSIPWGASKVLWFLLASVGYLVYPVLEAFTAALNNWQYYTVLLKCLLHVFNWEEAICGGQRIICRNSLLKVVMIPPVLICVYSDTCFFFSLICRFK